MLNEYMVTISITVDAPDMGSAVLRVSRHEAWPRLLTDVGARYISVSVTSADDGEDEE